MTEFWELLLVILVMTLATFLTRATPFLLLHQQADHPLLRFLSRYTPPAIMTLLVLYSFSGVEFTAAPFGWPEIAASIITLGAHILWRQPLLSIFAGTAAYMYTVQQLV